VLAIASFLAMAQNRWLHELGISWMLSNDVANGCMPRPTNPNGKSTPAKILSSITASNPCGRMGHMRKSKEIEMG